MGPGLGVSVPHALCLWKARQPKEGGWEERTVSPKDKQATQRMAVV